MYKRQTGGLGDVLGSLPAALKAEYGARADIRVVMPVSYTHLHGEYRNNNKKYHGDVAERVFKHRRLTVQIYDRRKYSRKAEQESREDAACHVAEIAFEFSFQYCKHYLHLPDL